MKKDDRERTARLIHGFFTEIGIISQLSNTVFERALPQGMTMAQFGLLNHFARLGGQHTPARLADAFQVTKGAMTNTLHKLEKKGFLAIRPDSKDGRRKLVSLTPRGRRQQEKALLSFTPALLHIVDDQTLQDIVDALPHLRNIRNRLDDARG